MYLVMAPSRDGRCQILVDHEVETKISGSCGGSWIGQLSIFLRPLVRIDFSFALATLWDECWLMAQKFGVGFCEAFCGTLCQLETIVQVHSAIV